MMVVANLTFNFRSKYPDCIPAVCFYFFAINLSLLLLFLNYSLNELQVNYNNDRSRFVLFVSLLISSQLVSGLNCLRKILLKLCLILFMLIFFLLCFIFRDFTNPSLPTEQRGRSSQVDSSLIYLFTSVTDNYAAFNPLQHFPKLGWIW